MSKGKRVTGNVFSVISIFAISTFVLSSAFIVQTTFRPYYFIHVHTLGIEKSSGYSFEEISLAFNDVMDFIWKGSEFKTGNLAWSESGKSHFEDCVPLFHMVLWVFVISLVLLIVYFVLVKTKVLPKPRIFGFHPFFYSSILLLVLLIVVGTIGIVDFDALFTMFHSLFFPGKSNWIFDQNTDQVILILPESFFLCCGVFAAVVVFLEIALMSFLSLFWHRKERKARKKQIAENGVGGDKETRA